MMSIKTTALSLPFFAVVLLLLSSPQIALSQAQVRDSAPVSSGAEAATAIAVPAITNPGSVVSAPPVNQAFQIQQLQQEILELRGLVEEMRFELKRLKQQRLDDYLDLDKRLAELSNTTPANNRADSPNASSSSVGVSSASVANDADYLDD
ncbi:MAG: YbgF trimerization domain-containing protein, partial [Pseudomonadota bacterium]